LFEVPKAYKTFVKFDISIKYYLFANMIIEPIRLTYVIESYHETSSGFALQFFSVFFWYVGISHTAESSPMAHVTAFLVILLFECDSMISMRRTPIDKVIGIVDYFSP
jgi:hypothetical protein